MARVDSPDGSQLAVGPAFRRVVQATASNTLVTDRVTERTGTPVSRHVSIPPEQFVDSSTEEDAVSQHSVRPISRLIIAVDFGTTYSCVSYAKIDPDAHSTGLPISEIRCIDNYECAGGSLDNRVNARSDNVPTKLLYLDPKVTKSKLPDSDSGSSSDSDCLSGMEIQPIPTPDRVRKRRRKRDTKSSFPNLRRRPRTTWTQPAEWTVRWGYSVPHMQNSLPEIGEYPEREAVELIKLTLCEEGYKDEDLHKKCAELAQQVERLHSKRVILNRDHLLYDYLARLLQHAKARLEEEALLESAQLEYVLCVPVAWSENACRIMHDAMVKAIQASGLSAPAQDVIPDVFIVSEPEAAAQYVIASLICAEQLRRSEVFTILDAGGGTVDITTYRVTSGETGPLRIQGEVIAPEGALCGSGMITARYLRNARTKLREMDPTGDPDSLEAMATGLANHWDMYSKPKIDVTNRETYKHSKGMQIFHNKKRSKWTEDEICGLFEPSLKGTTDLLERQLRLAKEKGTMVNKLIVVGGFGESPSLKARIRRVLSTWDNGGAGKIDAIWPKDYSTSAVARGAVLRAFDKRNGPSRISRSSFGFLRDEQYGVFPEHDEANVKSTRDGVDHDKFVRDTIYWLIQVGDELPSQYQSEPTLSCHTFARGDVKLVCVEKLYVSRRRQRSHFQCHHPENKEATLLSQIEIDVSDLKSEFPLEPKTQVCNRDIRMVKFDLVINVEGKQLNYEARWPPGAQTPEEVRVRKSGCVSLAPSFAPGTE